MANPFSPPFDYRPDRLAKKVAAGAQFIQTQLVFNLDRFREYMRRVVDLGLHEQVAILAGIGPTRSLRVARYMHDNVPGIDVPESMLSASRDCRRRIRRRRAFDLCCEIAEAVRSIEGVRGLHIMAMSWTAAVPRLTRALGLYPRPDLPERSSRLETVLPADS